MPIDFGDLNNIFAGNLAASMQALTTEQASGLRRLSEIGTMSLNRLDAMAQKSAFEVDANETGITNANAPRAAGGALS